MCKRAMELSNDKVPRPPTPNPSNHVLMNQHWVLEAKARSLAEQLPLVASVVIVVAAPPITIIPGNQHPTTIKTSWLPTIMAEAKGMTVSFDVELSGYGPLKHSHGQE